MIRYIVLVLLLLKFSVSTAMISVSPVIIDLQSGKSSVNSQLLKIKNVAMHKIYVQLTPRVIENPGKKNERRKLIADPRKAGLFVTPSKLIIPPKSERTVKVAVIGAPKQTDKIYRIDVAPKVANEYFSKEKLSAGLQLLISYDVLVIRRPLKPQAIISIQRSDRTVTVTNTGNSNALLFNGKQCVKGRCQSLPVHRMYAGNKWVFKVPAATPVTFEQQFMEQKTELKSN